MLTPNTCSTCETVPLTVISVELGAVLTTPEVITQILMAIPMLVLYEITVWIAWYWERQEKKREAQV